MSTTSELLQSIQLEVLQSIAELLCEIAAAPVYAVVHGGHQKPLYFAFFVPRIDLIANLIAMAARTRRAARACY